MDPKLWGRSGWTFLFSVALNFPQNPDYNDIHNYKRFFTDIQYILPCQICCENYVDHLQQIPIEPYLMNTQSLFTWLMKIHNLVNQSLKKLPLNESDILFIYLNNQSSNINFKLCDFSTWKFLFSIAEGYPENPSIQDMFHYKRFFNYLRLIFPCPIYKKYYSQLFNDIIIDSYLKNNHSLFVWILKIYNKINLQINRPILTILSVKKKYFSKSHTINKRPIKHQNIEGFSINNYDHPIDSYDSNSLSKNLSVTLLIIFLTVILSNQIQS